MAMKTKSIVRFITILSAFISISHYGYAAPSTCKNLKECVMLRDSLKSNLAAIEAQIQKLSPGACPISGSGFESLYKRLMKLGTFKVAFQGPWNIAQMSFSLSKYDGRPEFKYLCTNAGCYALTVPIRQWAQTSTGSIVTHIKTNNEDLAMIEVNCAESKVRATVENSFETFDLPL